MPEKEKIETTNQDEDDRFAEDPEAKYRIYNVISYFVILVVIGIPIWWITTRVYRASLPLDEMASFKIPNKTIRENSIPLSLEYDVLITILNPDPSSLNIDLNSRVLTKNLEPFLKTVEPIANFTVKSQWLYLVDLGVQPKKIGDNFIIFEDQLPLIITPLEKKFWSHMSPRPTLNLVIYVSPCNTPLFIYNNQNTYIRSNAFLSPRWGGILILNPDEDSCKARSFKPEVSNVLSTFLTQLRQLIGLHGSSNEDIVGLKKMKIIEMIDSTRRTLKSLAQLLSEINSIVISDKVGLKIEKALENARKAELYLKENNIDEALKVAKIAFYNSEAAFGDPSLLALLYFPDDQKYAVYIPLFLPIMIPVFMSLTTVRRWYLKEQIKSKID